MKRIGLLGSGGRMGGMVVQALANDFADQATLVASCARGDSHEPLLATDVIIDFSTPEAALALMEAALPGSLPPFVSGTTGWNTEQTSRLNQHARHHCLLLAANFATGVLALRHILRGAAPLLAGLGYTPVITETHHCHKKDAPSGTALALARDIDPKHPASVQTHSLRAGEVIGDHEARFYGTSDTLTIGHHSADRAIYARGAVSTALWLAGKPRTNGLLDMDDFFADILANTQGGA